MIALDNVNTEIVGGWLDHNWKQLYIQFAYVCATVAYTFVVTAALAYAINKIPGLALRAPREDEALGMDDAQIGEFANDYVEVRRDFTDWTPAPTRSDSNKKTWSAIDEQVAAGDRHGAPDTGINTFDLRNRAARPTDSSSDGHVAAGDRHGNPDTGPTTYNGDAEKRV